MSETFSTETQPTRPTAEPTLSQDPRGDTEAGTLSPNSPAPPGEPPETKDPDTPETVDWDVSTHGEPPQETEGYNTVQPPT